MLHWLAHWLGLLNASGPIYSFWSGFGSDLTEFALLVGAVGLYKHHNCAWKGCPRFARKHWQVKGTPLRTCHHHATRQCHTLLLKQYKRDHKEQHELFNQ